MADELYPGVAIDIFRSALPDGMPPRALARFWRWSDRAPGKVWVIAYHYGRSQQWESEIMLLPRDGVRLSERATEPPPLPAWAYREDQ